MLGPRGQTGLDAKMLALTSTSCSVSASSIWPRPGLGLVTCPRKCAIQCIIISVLSFSWLYRCNIHYKDVVKHSDVGHKFIHVLLACRHVFLFRNIVNIYMSLHGLDLDVLASFNALQNSHNCSYPARCGKHSIQNSY